MVGSFQYLVCCIAFSISKPFRQPLYTNYWLTGSFIILFAYGIFFTFYENPKFDDFMGVRLKNNDKFIVLLRIQSRLQCIRSQLWSYGLLSQSHTIILASTNEIQRSNSYNSHCQLSSKNLSLFNLLTQCTYFYEKVVVWYLTLWWKGAEDRKQAAI